MDNRLYRVSKLIKEEVSKLIQKEITLDQGFATVKEVEVTADLHYATVWISYIGHEEKECFVLLAAKQKDIQKTLNHLLNLKYVPLIEFKPDHSGDYVERIDQTIKDANQEQ